MSPSRRSAPCPASMTSPRIPPTSWQANGGGSRIWPRTSDVAFVPRYGREILDGDSSRILLLRKTHHLRELLSVKVNGTSKTLTDFVTYEFGQIVWKTGVFTTTWTSPQNIEVTYEHGYDGPDEDLRQAALTAIQTKLLGDQSGIPDRATSMTTDVGTFGLALAGPGRPTGIPGVDAV